MFIKKFISVGSQILQNLPVLQLISRYLTESEGFLPQSTS